MPRLYVNGSHTHTRACARAQPHTRTHMYACMHACMHREEQRCIGMPCTGVTGSVGGCAGREQGRGRGCIRGGRRARSGYGGGGGLLMMVLLSLQLLVLVLLRVYFPVVVSVYAIIVMFVDLGVSIFVY